MKKLLNYIHTTIEDYKKAAQHYENLRNKLYIR